MNESIFFFFYNLAHQNVFLDNLIIFLADIFPYLVIISAGIFLLFHHDVLPSRNPFWELVKKWKEVSFVFFTSFLAWVLAFILKFLFHTARPFDLFPQVIPLFSESGFAFPSGHATFFMALAFAIFWVHKKAGYFFIFFALLIGLARIMAGVHSPIDILGGFIFGFLIAFLVKKL